MHRTVSRHWLLMPSMVDNTDTDTHRHTDTHTHNDVQTKVISRNLV